MTGTIYAPAAQLAESGNAQLNAAVVVDTLTISGNGVANIVTLNAPAGKVASTPYPDWGRLRHQRGVARWHRSDHRQPRRRPVDALLSDPGMPRSLLVLDGEGVPIKRKLYSLLV